MGRWKTVAARNQPWELYDLETDRGEQSDIAESRPAILYELTQRWDAMTHEFTRNSRPDVP